MFGRGNKRPEPPSTEFVHGDRCRMRDARPEWIDQGSGLWQRACVCTSETWRAPEVRQAEPGPDVTRHRHIPQDCPATAVVKEDPSGGKHTYCWACQTYTHTLKVPADPFDREDFLAGLVT